MSERKRYRGRIIQTTPSGREGVDDVVIGVEDETSGIRFVEIYMTLEEWGTMLSAPRYASCTFEIAHTDKVGWVHEHKRVTVSAPHSPTDAEKDAALAPFEVDGWKATRSDLGNMHRRVPDGYVVSFHRHIPPSEVEP